MEVKAEAETCKHAPYNATALLEDPLTPEELDAMPKAMKRLHAILYKLMDAQTSIMKITELENRRMRNRLFLLELTIFLQLAIALFFTLFGG